MVRAARSATTLRNHGIVGRAEQRSQLGRILDEVIDDGSRFVIMGGDAGAGKSRLVADPKGRGFMIIKTNKIVPGNAMNNPMLIAQTQAEFQQSASNELGQQMLIAMKTDQGVTRNEEKIAAAKRRITGSGQ